MLMSEACHNATLEACMLTEAGLSCFEMMALQAVSVCEGPLTGWCSALMLVGCNGIRWLILD